MESLVCVAYCGDALLLWNVSVQYCAKVMQTIIDENRDNRELSAIFERYFD